MIKATLARRIPAYTTKAMQSKYKIIAASLALAAVFGGVSLSLALASAGHDDEAAHTETEAAQATSVLVETASDGAMAGLADGNVSWSGEILSLSDVSVHPLREGQISEWRVRLGQRVYAGQVLGRLSPPPASLELSSALAERAQAVARVRAAAEAAEKIARDSSERLEQLKAVLDKTRDAGIATSRIDAEQAAAAVPLKRQMLRASLERLAYRTAGLASRSGSSPATADDAASFQFKWGIGVYSDGVQQAYRSALAALLAGLKDPSSIPEKEGLAYSKVLQALLSGSAAIGDMTQESLADLREAALADQEAFLDALDAYQQALAAEKSRASEIPKITVETEKEIAVQKSELDAQVAELERDVFEARAEAEAAAVGYATLAAGVAGQNIIASRSGVVSSIRKNVGDHVTPEDVVASVGAPRDAGAFVRFKVPGDLVPPAVGDTVVIERPGRAFAGIDAKVVGVGASLDENGSYAADAEFLSPTDWPVHASVRVIPKARASSAVLVPLGAVWKDEEDATHVWLVMENGVIRPQPVLIGRTLGDRVEALEGLQNGDRFVARAESTLKTGQSVNATAEAREAEPTEAGDGHGHSHGE